MKVELNGSVKEIAETASLADLLASIEVPLEGTALVLNGEVVPRLEYAATALKNGDSVDLVRMVGGG